MAQLTATPYVVGEKYLFKTGLDSYVLGHVKALFTDEIQLKDARLQIPPSKIEAFMGSWEQMKEQPVHSTMIIMRVNIDWAVPVK